MYLGRYGQYQLSIPAAHSSVCPDIHLFLLHRLNLLSSHISTSPHLLPPLSIYFETPVTV